MERRVLVKNKMLCRPGSRDFAAHLLYRGGPLPRFGVGYHPTDCSDIVNVPMALQAQHHARDARRYIPRKRCGLSHFMVVYHCG